MLYSLLMSKTTGCFCANYPVVCCWSCYQDSTWWN